MKIGEKHGSSWQLSEDRTAPRQGSSAQRGSVAVGISPVEQAFPLSCSSEFLIANARLESPASHSKQRTGAKSNRERMAVSCLSFSLFSSPEPQAPSLRNLIVTPRLESCATRTKQSSFSISNRYKMHFSPPCCLAATRFTRYNSGSHFEVNQL